MFIPLVDRFNVSLKERFSQFSSHNLKWGFLYDLKHLPDKDRLKVCCKNLQEHLTNEGLSDINGDELYNEVLHIGSLINGSTKDKVFPIEVLKLIKSTD